MAIGSPPRPVPVQTDIEGNPVRQAGPANAGRSKGAHFAAAALAKDAAPYMHPRLAAVEQSGPDGGPMVNEVVYRWMKPGEEA